MIDNLGFHTDRDLHTELATLQNDIRILENRVTHDLFSTHEDRINTTASLDHCTYRAALLTEEIAADDACVNRLAAAIRTVGDLDLGFIAYVVFGPQALPVPPLYEIRIVERCGDYTVPGAVRRSVPKTDLERVEAELFAFVLRRGGPADLWGYTRHDYRPQVLAY